MTPLSELQGDWELEPSICLEGDRNQILVCIINIYQIDFITSY